MNRNHLIAFGLTITLLALAAFALSQLFEIYPRARYFSPSREASANEYLALERWLLNYDIPVRTVNGGDITTIKEAAERGILIQESLFTWTEEAGEYLASWVREGGHLFLAVDFNRDFVTEFLAEEFGINIMTHTERVPYSYNVNFPNYERRIYFEVLPGKEALLFPDPGNFTRLVQVEHEKGILTVSGRPLFLYSTNLDRESNAALAWGILNPETDAARTTGAYEEAGWLFIRRNFQQAGDGILGSLFSEGNFAVLLVSLMVLLIVGFWAVIPMFGLIRAERERPGKPLRERFLAEGRFIKRYSALDFYRDIYIKEIKRRLIIKGLSPEDAEEQTRLLHDADLRPGDFPGLINKLKSKLENI